MDTETTQSPQRGIKFHYKLTLSIVCFILAALLGFSLLTYSALKQDFTKRIEDRLQEAKLLVHRLMGIRKEKMQADIIALSEYQLVLTAIRSTELDQATRNDILVEEVLPYYPEINSIFVVDSRGEVISSTQSDTDMLALIKKKPAFNTLLKGSDRSVICIWKNGVCYEIIGSPIYTDNALTHVLFASFEMSGKFIHDLEKLSGVELALLSQEGPQIPSGIIKSLRDTNDRVMQTEVDGERLLYTIITAEHEDSPTIVMSRSLDKELLVVELMRRRLYSVAAAIMLLSLFSSYFLSRGVSRPVEELKKATQAITRADYSHRVNIRSKDEFRELGQSFNQMASELQEKERMRELMDKVVSREVAHELLEGNSKLGGKQSVITVLFTDIRGFTGISENICPDELLKLLNHYFACMAECIHQNGGVIDKYIGDAIMILYGAPEPLPYPTKSAVLTSLSMLETLNQFNKSYLELLPRPLKIGIGINTGQAILGMLGTEQRMNYTAIGNEVNIASRLEGLSKEYGVSIIISESSYRELQKQLVPEDPCILCRRLDSVRVRGKEKSTEIYEVMPPTKDNAKQQLLIDNFEAARDLMLKRDFQRAQQAFCKILVDFPTDPPSQVFLSRSKRYRDNPTLFSNEYHDGVYLSS